MKAGRFAWPFLIAALFGWAVVYAQECSDNDGDGFSHEVACGLSVDCDDWNSYVYPGAIEKCNGIDDDCDGTLDNGCARACVNPQPRVKRLRLPGSAKQYYPRVARAPRGYGVLWTEATSVGCGLQTQFAAIDDDGTVRGTASIGMTSEANGTSETVQVVWAGNRFITAFEDGPCSGRKQIFIQLLDDRANRIGQPQQLSCPDVTAFVNVIGVTWTGQYGVVAWHEDTGRKNGVYFARVRPDGLVLDPCGKRVVADPPTQINEAVLKWGGGRLGLLFVSPSPADPSNGEVYFQRFDENLEALDSEAHRITNDTLTSIYPELAWADGEWGATWTQSYVGPGFQEIAFARIAADGSIVSPPGVVRVTTGADSGGTNKALSWIQWTGTEYGIHYTDFDNAQLGFGDIRIARVSRSGSHIGADPLLTNDRYVHWSRGAWSGTDYAIAYEDYKRPGAIDDYFTWTGCNCTDADGDHYTTCRGDCDDGRADVNPVAVEVCGDGIDNNCDGLVDCGDTARCPAMGTAPGPVSGLVIAPDRVTLSWLPVFGATHYDVSRGAVTDLSYDGNGKHASCLESNLSAVSATDSARPYPKDGYYYLVRADAGSATSCQEGDWGLANSSSIQACP